MNFEQWWGQNYGDEEYLWIGVGKDGIKLVKRASQRAWEASVRAHQNTKETANSAVALLKEWYNTRGDNSYSASSLDNRTYVFLKQQPCQESANKPLCSSVKPAPKPCARINDCNIPKGYQCFLGDSVKEYHVICYKREL